MNFINWTAYRTTTYKNNFIYTISLSSFKLSFRKSMRQKRIMQYQETHAVRKCPLSH